MAENLHLTFDDGTLDEWDTLSGTITPTADAAAAYAGSYGMLATGAGNFDAYVAYSTGTDQHFTLFVKFSSNYSLAAWSASRVWSIMLSDYTFVRVSVQNYTASAGAPTAFYVEGPGAFNTGRYGTFPGVDQWIRLDLHIVVGSATESGYSFEIDNGGTEVSQFDQDWSSRTGFFRIYTSAGSVDLPASMTVAYDEIIAADEKPSDPATVTYTVTYDANSGTGTLTDANSPYEESDTVTVLHPSDDGTIARTGYAFVEWNTAANGSGTAYDPDDTFSMGTSNVTLYAQWQVATTPICPRPDVVPYQRIDTGETFKFGVVAFCKGGIDDVDFVISGQGYSGGTKTASSMTLNDRTGIWEYWVSIAASEFTSDGAITVTATVHGTDGGTRELDAVPLNVNPNGTLQRHEAWVTSGGNDGTGTVDNEGLPFATIDAAVAAIAAAGSSADGGIVYLGAGTWDPYTTAETTTYEWLTVTKAAGLAVGDVTLSSGSYRGMDISLLHLKDVTIGGTSNNWNTTHTVWWDGVVHVGGGQWTENSNRMQTTNSATRYATDVSVSEVDYAFNSAHAIIRGCSASDIGNDFTVNTSLVLGCSTDGVDPGETTYWHADGYQSHSASANNRILYQNKFRDMHYQGIFIRPETDETVAHTDIAIVNNLIEMRTPAREQFEGGATNLDNAGLVGKFNHLVMWGNSFPAGDRGVYVIAEDGEKEMVNSSICGNLFLEWLDWTDWADPAYSEPSNTDNNEFLENHYIESFVDDGTSHARTISPDTDAGVSHTYGDAGIDDTATSETFGAPQTGSTLLARWTPLVPVDADGNARSSPGAVGALEYVPTYTVTYNGNGADSGSAPTDANAYIETETVTVAGAGTLVKDGYTISEWNTAANGSGTGYSLGGTFAMPGSNVTLYAQWAEAPAAYSPRSPFHERKTSRRRAIIIHE